MKMLEEPIQKRAEISPYLAAIQSLGGQTPGEKYKQLNLIVKNVVASNGSVATDEPMDVVQDVPTAMAPLVQILTGKALKSHEAVIEALKSEDLILVNKALQAKWFFQGSNPTVNADYFITNIMPYVSERTQFQLIKILSRSLVGEEKKAEEFFNAFAKLYGLEQAMPIFFVTGKDFVKGKILKQEVSMSYHVLLNLYRKYPDLAIYFLMEHVENENKKRMKLPYDENFIRISDKIFFKFLPLLLKRHSDTFIYIIKDQLYDSGWLKKIPMSKKQTKLFFNCSKNLVVEHPRAFFNVWKIDEVMKYISKSQIECILNNLFPKNKNDLNTSQVLQILKYYEPKEKRFNLLSEVYKKKYSREFLDDIEIDKISRDICLIYKILPIEYFELLFAKSFPYSADNFNPSDIFPLLDRIDYPIEKRYELLTKAYYAQYNKNLCDHQIEESNFSTWLPMVELFPIENKIDCIQKVINSCIDKYEGYERYKWYRYLPLSINFPILKEIIGKTTNDSERSEYIELMLYSCKFYNNEEDLLQVLKYYNIRHKNEKIEVLSTFLAKINCIFNLYKLNRSHYNMIYEILQRARVKNEIQRMNKQLFVHVIGTAMLDVSWQCNKPESMNEEDKAFLDKLLDITVDYNVTARKGSEWIFAGDNLVFKKHCLDKLLELLPLKYPKTHFLWQTKEGMVIKSKLASDILKAFMFFNGLYDRDIKNHSISKDKLQRIAITSYPWLIEFLDEVFNSSSIYERTKAKLKERLRSLEQEVYHELLPDKTVLAQDVVADIKSGAAWLELKRNRENVLAHWHEYLTACRAQLKQNTKHGGAAARRFLLAVKWHEDIPVKMVEACLEDIEGPANVKVLALLLEGEVLHQLVRPLAPQSAKIDIEHEEARNRYLMLQSIPAAMNLVNPPVSFDAITAFCQGDYVNLAVQAFTHLSYRLTKWKITEFTKQLITKPVSVKKHGLRLFFKKATQDSLLELVQLVWETELNASIRELTFEMAQLRLMKTPCEHNWRLMETCIDGLTVNDEVLICKIGSERIKTDSKYMWKCVDKLLNKIEDLALRGLNTTIRVQFVCRMFSQISIPIVTKHMSEDELLHVIEKYFFNENSDEIVESARLLGLIVFNIDKYT